MLRFEDGILGEYEAAPRVVVATGSVVHMHLQSLPQPRGDVMITNVGSRGVCLQ